MSKKTAYSYEAFDLDAALDGRSNTSKGKGFKLPGTENIRDIYNSHSTSTEEFVIGAVEALGQANRNLMFVNMSIEGFEDRLNIAARVAKNVKIARDRGLEGFENVKPLNPLVYALEGEKGESAGSKVAAFFKRIAQAIVTAARHIMTMIANFIKMIVNKIREFAQSGYSKKYKQYCALSGKSKKSADAVTINSMDWKVDQTKMVAIIDQLTKNYNNCCNTDAGVGGALKAIVGIIGKFKSLPIVGKPAGNVNASADLKIVKSHIEKIDNARSSGIMFEHLGIKVKNGDAKNIRLAFYNGEKPVKMTCEKIRKITGDFKILSEESMKDFATALASGKKAQVQAAKSTKEMDKLAAELKKEHKDPQTIAFKKEVAKLAARYLAFNSYANSIYLEAQSIRLRYTHTAYVAMKQYLKTGDINTKVTRGNESYSQIDVDDLFSNL